MGSLRTKYLVSIWALALYLTAAVYAQSFVPSSASQLTLPNKEGSVKLLATGDTGRGNREQNELGKVMANFQTIFKFDMVLLAGDNMYGTQKAIDYKLKFEDPYKELLDRDVKFYASLGNHDEPAQVNYKHFNMDGKEYYQFRKGEVSFYALNSTYMDKKQIDWFIATVEKDKAPWKIAFFHHPPYSSGGRHGSDEKIREVLHPLFIKYGVDVAFTGHDHFYERVKPQDGVRYFVTGAGGKIRKGDLKDRSKLTEKGFDSDLCFMLVEFVGDEMHFQVISRAGKTVDSGIIFNRK
jgi:hypothetical protein